MKKLIVTLLTVFFCLLALHNVLAAGPAINELTPAVGQKAGYDVNIDKYELSRTIGRVIQGAMALIGMIFLVLTVYAGFLWLTAGGNEENVTKAQGILRAAVIGLVIVLSSYGITVFVATVISSQDDQGFWGAFYGGGFGTYTGMVTTH